MHKIYTKYQTPQPSHKYERLKDMPRLIPMWPYEIQDFSKAGCLNIISQTEKALRGERRRGKSGHWTYSLSRHMSLLTAYKAEKAYYQKHYTEQKSWRVSPGLKTATALSSEKHLSAPG